MMVLILGGSGSGKSFYAEKVVLSLSDSSASPDMKRYYLATMLVSDDEGKQRVLLHRKLRSGKGFITIEQPIQIHKALEKMESGKKIALLECISNLVANEMFSQDKIKPEMAVITDVIKGICMLKKEITHLVLVSNNIFEDGTIYDKTTMEYIHAMGKINQRLAAMADKVVEVVAGIPVTIK